MSAAQDAVAFATRRSCGESMKRYLAKQFLIGRGMKLADVDETMLEVEKLLSGDGEPTGLPRIETGEISEPIIGADA